MSNVKPIITYTNHIHAMDIVPAVDNLKNVVVRVKWEMIARCGVHVCSSYMVTQLQNVQNQKNFISFENLTESMVLDWVFNVVSASQIKSRLDAKIKEKLASPTAEFLPPWGQSADWSKRLFVLVHNNEVIWGPARWNAEKINSIFQQHNLKVYIDKSWINVPQTASVKITNDTWIYTAKEHWEEIENLMFYTHDNAQWEFSELHGATATYNKIEKPLEEIRQTMISSLVSSKSEELSFNVVSLNIGDTFIQLSQQYFMMCVCALLIDDSITQIKVMDINGYMHTVLCADLKQALAQFAMNTLQPEVISTEIETLIEQIKSAKTVKQLMQIQQDQ